LDQRRASGSTRTSFSVPTNTALTAATPRPTPPSSTPVPTATHPPPTSTVSLASNQHTLSAAPVAPTPGANPTATNTSPPSVPQQQVVTSHLSSGGDGSAPPPTHTPIPPPDCGHSGQREDSAPPAYASDPRSPEGRDHRVFGSGPLRSLRDRDDFRATLPARTNLAPVDDAIARGCSAHWIRTHLNSLSTTALP
jgi:hypothetical protein